MRINLKPTKTMVHFAGHRVRVWEGEDDHGVPVMALVVGVSPQTHDEATNARYEAALEEAHDAVLIETGLELRLDRGNT